MIDGSSSLILTTFTGLHSARMDALRGTVKEKSGRYFVVKNRTFGIAARQRGLEKLCDSLTGQVGVVFSEGDATGLLKAVVKFGKESEELKILGGLFEGQVRSAGQMLAIGAMPPKEIAAGEFVGVLVRPLSEVVQALSETLRSLVFIIGSIGGKEGNSVSE